MHIDILLESQGQLHLDTFLCKVVDVQLHQKVADRKALCLNILSHQVFQKKDTSLILNLNLNLNSTCLRSHMVTAVAFPLCPQNILMKENQREENLRNNYIGKNRARVLCCKRMMNLRCIFCGYHFPLFFKLSFASVSQCSLIEGPFFSNFYVLSLCTNSVVFFLWLDCFGPNSVFETLLASHC